MSTNKTTAGLLPGAGHKKLHVFVGKWITKGQTKAGPAGETLLITGTDSYEWLPGKFFLVHHWNVRMGSEEHTGIEIIGYDERTNAYPTYSFDNRGNNSCYQASTRDGIWAFRARSERATVVVSGDGNTITASWEQLADGLNWQPWMEIKLTRVHH